LLLSLNDLQLHLKREGFVLFRQMCGSYRFWVQPAQEKKKMGEKKNFPKGLQFKQPELKDTTNSSDL